MFENPGGATDPLPPLPTPMFTTSLLDAQHLNGLVWR